MPGGGRASGSERKGALLRELFCLRAPHPPAQDSKCTGIRPRSVEVLFQCGALDELGGASKLTPVCDLPVYACSQAEGPLRLLYSLRAAAPRQGCFGQPDARPCIAYSLEQWRVERALLARLERRAGASVRPSTRLAAFNCEARGVTVQLQAAAGAGAAGPVRRGAGEVAARPGFETLRCKYLVGCDGVAGGVRGALGIARDGASYDELFLIADVELEGFT